MDQTFPGGCIPNRAITRSARPLACRFAILRWLARALSLAALLGAALSCPPVAAQFDAVDNSTDTFGQPSQERISGLPVSRAEQQGASIWSCLASAARSRIAGFDAAGHAIILMREGDRTSPANTGPGSGVGAARDRAESRLENSAPGKLSVARFGPSGQAVATKQYVANAAPLSLYVPPQNQKSADLGGLLFLADQNGDERYGISYQSLAFGAGRAAISPANTRNAAPKVSRDGRYVLYTRAPSPGVSWGVIEADLVSGASRQVFQQPGAWQTLAISPDNSFILVQEVFGLEDRVVYFVHRKSGVKYPVFAGRRPAAVRDAAIDPTNQYVYLILTEWQSGGRLLRITRRTGEVTTLLLSDYPLDHLAVSSDGDMLAVSENVDGRGAVHVLAGLRGFERPASHAADTALSGEKRAPLSAGEAIAGLLHRVFKAPDDASVRQLMLATRPAVTALRDDQPYEALGYQVGMTLASLGMAQRAAVLTLPDLRAQEPGVTGMWQIFPATGAPDCSARVSAKSIKIERQDRVAELTHIPALLLMPNNDPTSPTEHASLGERAKGDAGSPKIPLIIAFHGGPEGQWRRSGHQDYIALADTLGAAVLMPNVAGSVGYGLSYASADNGLKRRIVLDDINTILAWVRAHGGFDTGRVAVMGASYGGYLALMTAATFPGQIAAAVSDVGIADLPSFLSETPLTRRALRRSEYGDERDATFAAQLRALSPLSRVAAIEANVFLSHGANDARVPVTQSRMMEQALKKAGKSVTYVEFPQEGHIIRNKAVREQLRRAQAAFLVQAFAQE